MKMELNPSSSKISPYCLHIHCGDHPVSYSMGISISISRGKELGHEPDHTQGTVQRLRMLYLQFLKVGKGKDR
jgi:hypothetical protein